MQITRTAQADRTSPDFWVLLNRAVTLADRGIPDDAGIGEYGSWHMNSSHFALSAARTARLAVDALAAVARLYGFHVTDRELASWFARAIPSMSPTLQFPAATAAVA